MLPRVLEMKLIPEVLQNDEVERFVVSNFGLTLGVGYKPTSTVKISQTEGRYVSNHR